MKCTKCMTKEAVVLVPFYECEDCAGALVGEVKKYE